MRRVIRLFLALMLATSVASASLAQSQERLPFKIQVVDKPAHIANGQKYKLTLEIKNLSSDELILCLLPGFNSYSWYWPSPNGLGGVGFGSYRSKTIIGTAYDPVTQKFECHYSHYERSDFITIPPFGSKIIETDIQAPANCRAKNATLTINFESQFDGSELNLKAWTGKARPLQITFPVRKTQANRILN